MNVTQDELKLANEVFKEKWLSDDPQQVKQAEALADNFTRVQMREDGICRRVMPLEPIRDDELDRQQWTEKNVKIVDIEGEKTTAKSIPYGTNPDTLYIKVDRYAVTFDRIVTRQFTVDVTKLRTNHIDIRTVMSDNSIKDLLDEEDRKFFRAVNDSIVSPGAVVPTSGVVQHEELQGGITRNSLWEMTKVLPSTPSSLEIGCAVTNHITIKDVCKATRNELGGDIAEEIMRNGWSYKRFMGFDWLISIKRDIIPNNRIYHFADPKFMGKFYELQPATMSSKREAWMIWFFHYEEIGGAIGNTNAVAAVDFIN
jgi:hypothetical protein